MSRASRHWRRPSSPAAGTSAPRRSRRQREPPAARSTRTAAVPCLCASVSLFCRFLLCGVIISYFSLSQQPPAVNLAITANPRAITVRNNHTPRADHALLHLCEYVTYRAKNIRFARKGGRPATAATGGAALVAPLGEAALSPLHSVGRAAADWKSRHLGGALGQRASCPLRQRRDC